LDVEGEIDELAKTCRQFKRIAPKGKSDAPDACHRDSFRFNDGSISDSIKSTHIEYCFLEG
jgi:hypothetical protein